MGVSDQVVPEPPVWDPAMARRPARPAPSPRDVEAFVAWVGSSPMSDVEAVRAAIAHGCDDDLIGVLDLELNRLPLVDSGRHDVLLSILGESRLESAIGPLERFIWNVVDVLGPFEVPVRLVVPQMIACELLPDVGRALRARAAEMLAFLATARAFDGVRRVIVEHPEVSVRRAAIDAYLYNHGDTADAQRDVRRFAREEDQVWVGIPRRTIDTDPDELREHLARMTEPLPAPDRVEMPSRRAAPQQREHLSTREPEF